MVFASALVPCTNLRRTSVDGVDHDCPPLHPMQAPCTRLCGLCPPASWTKGVCLSLPT